jgi:hypothetical protein
MKPSGAAVASLTDGTAETSPNAQKSNTADAHTDAVATPSPARLGVIPDLPSGYMVIDLGSTPHADELSFDQAAAIAADNWKTKFDDRTLADGAKLFVSYYRFEGTADAYYYVYTSRDTEGKARLTCTLDAMSGQIREIGKEYPEQKKEDDLESSDSELMTDMMNNTKVHEVVKEFVNEKLANGRTYEKLTSGCVSWDFNHTDIVLDVSCQVHMSEGECYFVTVAYPSYEVLRVEFYPLGWLSCYYGYYTEEQGKDYPDHEVIGQLPDLSE